MDEVSLRKTLTLKQYGWVAGFANAFACGIAGGIAVDKPDPIPAIMVIWFIGSVPSLLMCWWLIALGAKTRGASIAVRRLWVVGVGVGFASGLTAILLPHYFILWMLVPSFVTAFSIERRTRIADPIYTPVDDVVADLTAPVKVSPLVVGGLLGIANDVVCGIGIAFTERGGHHVADTFRTVVMFGFIPAICCGIVLGMVANAAAKLAVVLRLVLLGVPAVGVVATLASMFGLPQFFWLSCIPTGVGVMILERISRARAAVPVAIAR